MATRIRQRGCKIPMSMPSSTALSCHSFKNQSANKPTWILLLTWFHHHWFSFQSLAVLRKRDVCPWPVLDMPWPTADIGSMMMSPKSGALSFELATLPAIRDWAQRLQLPSKAPQKSQQHSYAVTRYTGWFLSLKHISPKWKYVL